MLLSVRAIYALTISLELEKIYWFPCSTNWWLFPSLPWGTQNNWSITLRTHWWFWKSSHHTENFTKYCQDNILCPDSYENVFNPIIIGLFVVANYRGGGGGWAQVAHWENLNISAVFWGFFNLIVCTGSQ